MLSCFCPSVSISTTTGGTSKSASTGSTSTGHTNSTSRTNRGSRNENYSLVLLFVILTSLLYPLDIRKIFE